MMSNNERRDVKIIQKERKSLDEYDPNVFLGWLDRMINMMSTHGGWKILKGAIMFLIVSWIIYLTFNPQVIFDTYTKIKNEQHTKAMENRIEVDPDIRLKLKEILYRSGACRAFILEMHNGTNNMSGLPFMYFDLTYEEVQDGVYSIAEDYRNITLSRFPFGIKLYKEGFWFGNMDELALIDEKLASKLKLNDVEYMGIIVLAGQNSDIGFLGLTFTKFGNAPDINVLNQQLRLGSQRISSLLDGGK